MLITKYILNFHCKNNLIVKPSPDKILLQDLRHNFALS